MPFASKGLRSVPGIELVGAAPECIHISCLKECNATTITITITITIIPVLLMFILLLILELYAEPVSTILTTFTVLI